jgi:hypothetical protein
LPAKEAAVVLDQPVRSRLHFFLSIDLMSVYHNLESIKEQKKLWICITANPNQNASKYCTLEPSLRRVSPDVQLMVSHLLMQIQPT